MSCGLLLLLSQASAASRPETSVLLVIKSAHFVFAHKSRFEKKKKNHNNNKSRNKNWATTWGNFFHFLKKRKKTICTCRGGPPKKEQRAREKSEKRHKTQLQRHLAGKPNPKQRKKSWLRLETCPLATRRQRGRVGRSLSNKRCGVGSSS